MIATYSLQTDKYIINVVLRNQGFVINNYITNLI